MRLYFVETDFRKEKVEREFPPESRSQQVREAFANHEWPLQTSTKQREQVSSISDLFNPDGEMSKPSENGEPEDSERHEVVSEQGVSQDATQQQQQRGQNPKEGSVNVGNMKRKSSVDIEAQDKAPPFARYLGQDLPESMKLTGPGVPSRILNFDDAVKKYMELELFIRAAKVMMSFCLDDQDELRGRWAGLRASEQQKVERLDVYASTESQPLCYDNYSTDTQNLLAALMSNTEQAEAGPSRKRVCSERSEGRQSILKASQFSDTEGRSSRVVPNVELANFNGSNGISPSVQVSAPRVQAPRPRLQETPPRVLNRALIREFERTATGEDSFPASNLDLHNIEADDDWSIVRYKNSAQRNPSQVSDKGKEREIRTNKVDKDTTATKESVSWVQP